jgi:hypothetical protein
MLKKEFEFILQDNLLYSHDGKAGIQAKRLLLRAPSTKLLSLASALSAIVMTAFIKARENFKSDSTTKKETVAKEENVDGAGIYMIMSGSITTEQMQSFVTTFEELILSNGICLIDGKEPLTQDLFNSLDSRETIRLIGDYIANFLLPSTMTQSKKKI